MKKPNLVQRALQRLLGIAPSPLLNGKLVVKHYQNIDTPHELQRNDLVIFNTPYGTYIANYSEGDPNDVTNYVNVRILNN